MNKFRIFLLRAMQWRLQNLLTSVNDSLEWRQSAIDEKKLAHKKPELLDRKLIEGCKKELEPVYREYISTVSEEIHAMSLEQAAFLLNYCNASHPKSIVDFGSGFSSYVLRYYGKGKMVEVCSVDDDVSWLQKTTVFLKEKNLSVNRIVLADDFFETAVSGFYDLLYYDLGNIETRKKYLMKVLDLFPLHHHGALLIDDVHKIDFRSNALHSLKERSRAYYNLKNTTVDKFGRYAYLVMNTNNRADGSVK